jgi:hypothetical protein
VDCEPVELGRNLTSSASSPQGADVEGAVGNVGGRADLMASGQIIANEAPSTEELVASGHEIARDNAFAIYFYKSQIMIAFEKEVRRGIHSSSQS